MQERKSQRTANLMRRAASRMEHIVVRHSDNSRAGCNGCDSSACCPQVAREFIPWLEAAKEKRNKDMKAATLALQRRAAELSQQLMEQREESVNARPRTEEDQENRVANLFKKAVLRMEHQGIAKVGCN